MTLFGLLSSVPIDSVFPFILDKDNALYCTHLYLIPDNSRDGQNPRQMTDKLQIKGNRVYTTKNVAMLYAD